jgi:hypothetical protein
MMNLCRYSGPMQSHTRRWRPTCASLSGGLRTKRGTQTPSRCYRRPNSPSPSSKSTRVGPPTGKVRLYSNHNSLQALDWILGIYRQALALGPSRLTDVQRQIRTDRSIELLRLLESAQANNWQSFMTFDESWFYLCTSQEIVWVQAGQEPPERVRHVIGDRKLMVAIFGIHTASILLRRFQKARHLM